MFFYFAGFAVALVTCYLFNYPVRLSSRAVGFLDLPGERKLHKRAVPYGGGVAIFLALAATVIFLSLCYPPCFLLKKRLMGLIIGGLAVVMVGLWDDAKGTGALFKFTLEGGVAVLMYFYGFRIENLSVPAVGSVSLGGFSIVITIFWYWLIMNAINLIDGLDGLAAGVTGIAALTILVITLSGNQPFDIFLAAIILGLSLGFLPHNFHPARIFMGDTGSLLLGFLLGSLTLTTSTKAPAVLTLLIPLLAVGMPIFDTTHAFLRRLLSGSHPFRADTKHLHHRLLALGLSHRRVVLFLYYISIYLGVMAYILSRTSAQITLLVVILLFGGLFLLVENVSALERNVKGRPPDPF